MPTSHDRCFITKDPTATNPAVLVAPACYLPGDTNPTPSNAVDGQCQVCRPTGSGFLIPGTNAVWNREDWNLAEKHGDPCNDLNPRTHTDTCVNGACFGTYYDGTTDATRELVVNGVVSAIAVPGGPTATCDETVLCTVGVGGCSATDTCQAYNGGGQNTDGSPRRWAAGTALLGAPKTGLRRLSSSA